MGGQLGYQRGCGHPGLGVDLETGDAGDARLAVVVAEIGAGDAAAAERLMSEHGEALSIMRTLKKALDPDNIMNPGKIVRV